VQKKKKKKKRKKERKRKSDGRVGAISDGNVAYVEYQRGLDDSTIVSGRKIRLVGRDTRDIGFDRKNRGATRTCSDNARVTR
jgi:endonuclease YncB( thermonuclease family)